MEMGPMCRRLWLVCVLLPLGGCLAAPQEGGYGYAQPGYAPAGYPPPGYPPAGYESAPYDPYAGGYPSYSYNGGAPTI
jgi:hypothetical protein